MTNAHVVDGCRRISVDGKPAELIDSSAEFDLALLETNLVAPAKVAEFAATPAKLNSDITVTGYPLSGLLGGLNVTRGAVSSLTGLKGDGLNMQISAPVQPGNSGGPVVNANGSVVGVVVSKLDAMKMVDWNGDIPQNVNFAIRGEIAKLFLFQNGVEPKLSNNGNILASVELAEQAAKFTSFVECLK